NINKEAKVALYWSNVYEDKQIIPMEQLYTMPGVTSGPEIAPDVYEMTVTWSNTPGAEGYELEVDGAIVNVGLEAAYVHKGLEPNSQHTYRVRAVNELGKGGWSRTVTGLTLPDTPKNLASSSTSYAVALSWEAVPGVISYDIEADGNIIGSTPDTDYVHEGLQPVTEYTYRVRAVNASGAGYWSGPISELTKVGVPANINTVSASTAITFTWDADNEADSYEIELGGAMLDNGNNTAYEYTGLMPNSAHVYRRRAINELGCGDWSELRTKYTSPDIPRNITAASTGYGITLTWDAVEAAAGYDVEVQGSSVDNGNSTTYTHTDLDSNTQRTYRVRAKNEHGLGDWSGIIAKTTLSGVPVNLKEKWVPGTTDRQLLTLTGINPLGSKYDLSLNTASMKDRNGNGTRYSYDNRGLLTEKKVAETGDTVAYTYDMLGSRETMTDATGTSTYEYNGNNWLLSIEKDGEPQISYDYDEIGNIITITDKQGNTTEYTYDRSSRMETVSFEGRTTTYEYDENGNRESISYDGEVEETYSYDKNNSLLKLAEKLKDSAGKELMQKTTSFRYDSNGNEDRRSVEYITLYSKENPKAYEAAVYGEDSAEPIHAVVERTVSQYDGFNRLVRTAVEYAYGCVLKFRS
ncbi:MAG TPA: hypothetical protein VN580_05005, partial [Clostridia bacterium]|nr:hypothetical protein [Clostridia bacterium]